MTGRYLYRCYAADGRLLYVGVTGNLEIRLATHRGSSFWAPLVAKVRAEVHPDAEAAHAHERRAIREEHPRYNIVGRWGTHATWTNEQYDDYLLALSSRPATSAKDRHVQRVQTARDLLARIAV